MSLVVGELHGAGISVVGDTKITHAGDDRRTRHVFEQAMPKVLILRNDLCVGLAGNDPTGVASTLVDLRNAPVAKLLEAMRPLKHASVLIASLDPTPRLLQVTRGEVEERTDVGRAWVGDATAYDIFQQRYHEWPPGTDVPFLLVSSMQWLLSFNAVGSVGGYLTNVATTSDGFRYRAQPTRVGPELLHGLAAVAEHELHIELHAPTGGDTTWLDIDCLVGLPPTIGALAYYLDPPGMALLFHQDRPQVPILMRASSSSEMIQRARADHGQYLADSLVPGDPWSVE